MKERMLNLLFVFIVGCLALTGCQSSDDDDSPVLSTGTYSGVLVDPYIEGAILCEDVNNNGSCDSGEQLSSETTAAGRFYFSEEMTAGSTIIIKTQGKHNGVTYTVSLARKVESTSDSRDQVISPLTTLNAKGLTSTEIATMLQSGGLSTITADDVMKDPMSGISELTGTATNAEIVKLRSSIAVYAFLRIMNGSTTLSSLSGTQLYTSATTNGENLNQILTGMISLVKTGLDPAFISNIQSGMNQSPINLPSVSMEDIAKTAVAITDYVAKAGYETCNSTVGDDDAKVTAAMAEVATKTNNGANITTWANALGTRFYTARNKAALSLYRSHLGSYPDIVAGLDCASSVFYINDSGSVDCYAE